MQAHRISSAEFVDVVSTQERIGASVVAGAMAGIIFGMIMVKWGAPMPAGRMMTLGRIVYGTPSVPAGWLFHLVLSGALGAVFGALIGTRDHGVPSGMGWGLVYGFVLWIVGGLVVMPLLAGVSAFAPLVIPALRDTALVSLVGHLAYGAILGVLVGIHSGIPLRPGSY